MAANKTLGYILIAVGVLIILFVAFAGYALYVKLISGTLSFPQYAAGKGAGTGAAGSLNSTSAVVNQAVSSAVSQLLASIPIAMYGYVFLAIVALYLVLAAAGRLVIYGIKLLEVKGAAEESDQARRK